MADVSEDRLALAEKIDPELLQMLARMSRRQQRQVLLLLMIVENLLYEMMRERRAKEDLEWRPSLASSPQPFGRREAKGPALTPVNESRPVVPESQYNFSQVPLCGDEHS